jgi:hypothetical protein
MNHDLSQNENFLEQAKLLSKFANQLKYIGIYIVGFTGALAALVLVDSAVRSLSRTNCYWLVALFGGALLSLGYFEAVKRHGERIYGDITDQLHRMRARDTERGTDSEFRQALQQFTRWTDPPLVGGRHALAVYFVINLVFAGIFAFGHYVRQIPEAVPRDNSTNIAELRSELEVEMSTKLAAINTSNFSYDFQQVHESLGTVASDERGAPSKTELTCPEGKYVVGIAFSKTSVKTPRVPSFAINCAMLPQIRRVAR